MSSLRNLDFSSLHALLTTLLSLALITLLGVGIRLLTQLAIQNRRERVNRQINERLRALIAAYKTLGGSFTGDLTVNPAHRRDSQTATPPAAGSPTHDPVPSPGSDSSTGATAPLDLAAPDSDRARRVRDAVEAALSDIILLGTQDQVRMAASAATELAAGRLVHTGPLVVSMRDFIRDALDLDPIPTGLTIPQQGPARPGASSSKTDKSDTRGGSGNGGMESGSGGGMGGGGMGSGMGLGGGLGAGRTRSSDDTDEAIDPDETAAHGA